ANQPLPSCNTGGGNQWKQAISSITDTLGRVISFNYDNCNNLVSVTAPAADGTSSTVVQFDYAINNSISTSFSGLTVENMPSTQPIIQLSHVYYPATSTGYKFTYSAYGMVYNISRRKQMTYNTGTGAITDGTETAYTTFNYPTTASSLTDAPAFTQWTQFPA